MAGEAVLRVVSVGMMAVESVLNDLSFSIFLIVSLLGRWCFVIFLCAVALFARCLLVVCLLFSFGLVLHVFSVVGLRCSVGNSDSVLVCGFPLFV